MVKVINPREIRKKKLFVYFHTLVLGSNFIDATANSFASNNFVVVHFLVLEAKSLVPGNGIVGKEVVVSNVHAKENG